MSKYPWRKTYIIEESSPKHQRTLHIYSLGMVCLVVLTSETANLIISSFTRWNSNTNMPHTLLVYAPFSWAAVLCASSPFYFQLDAPLYQCACFPFHLEHKTCEKIIFLVVQILYQFLVFFFFSPARFLILFIENTHSINQPATTSSDNNTNNNNNRPKKLLLDKSLLKRLSG